jgi:hypothetical protein
MRTSWQIERGRAVHERASSDSPPTTQQKKRARKYARTKEGYLAKQTVRRREIRAFVWQWKVDHACVDCGESDPRCLDFDHREPSEKVFELSNSAAVTRSLDTVTHEIAKCDIRCANCHRKKTHKNQAHPSSPAVESDGVS